MHLSHSRCVTQKYNALDIGAKSKHCSLQKVQLPFTGNFISGLFSWKFLQRPNGEKIRERKSRSLSLSLYVCVCAQAWPKLVKSLLPSCFTWDYLCSVCEHVRGGGRACGWFFFSFSVLCVCVWGCLCVFFAFLLWLFPYPICPSFDNKGFSSLLCLCSQFTGKYVLDFYQWFCMSENLKDWKGCAKMCLPTCFT